MIPPVSCCCLQANTIHSLARSLCASKTPVAPAGHLIQRLPTESVYPYDVKVIFLFAVCPHLDPGPSAGSLLICIWPSPPCVDPFCFFYFCSPSSNNVLASIPVRLAVYCLSGFPVRASSRANIYPSDPRGASGYISVMSLCCFS